MSKNHTHKAVYLKQLGVRIRTLRLAAGYANHKTFAYKRGFGHAQWNRYETGKTEPGVYMIRRICQALEITEVDFYREGFKE